MNIFYGQSESRSDVPCDAPITASLDATLEILRGLDPRSGFIGIKLDEPFVLQLLHRKGGMVRVELLDHSIPAFDACDVEFEFAESLIRAAAEGRDVFQSARTSGYEWERWEFE